MNTRNTSCSRRNFLSVLGPLGLSGFMSLNTPHQTGDPEKTPASCRMAEKHTDGRNPDGRKQITIKNALSNFEREPLIKPFGFKGGFMSEKWQTAALLETDSGIKGIGLCSPSVLWADSSVFASWSENAGNALLYSVLDYALQSVKGLSFTDPPELLEKVFPDACRYGKKITLNPELRETFVLMALVALDNAAWLVYARENGLTGFDHMIPAPFQRSLSIRQERLASIPLFSYSSSIEEIVNTVKKGYFFLKIKIGQPGTPEEMLEKDKNRLSEIHEALKSMQTPHTDDNQLIYYLDANGRYESKTLFTRLLDHLEKTGALDRIIMIEEPFPEEAEYDVSGFGIPIVADESAHTDISARERIEMGYQGFAIKPAAKTLSMSLKIIKLAMENGLECFCADSTASPLLVDWNKNVAARLPALKGMRMGVIETNGKQNYTHWEKMKTYHPMAGATWTEERNGIFELEPDFYEHSGGIFERSAHYDSLFPKD